MSVSERILAYELREDCYCGGPKSHAGWLICVFGNGPDPEPEEPVWCPHCDYHVGMCRRADGRIDTDRWTDAERDAWREAAKREDPAMIFSPSSAQLADRFGAKNRR